MLVQALPLLAILPSQLLYLRGLLFNLFEHALLQIWFGLTRLWLLLMLLLPTGSKTILIGWPVDWLFGFRLCGR